MLRRFLKGKGLFIAMGLTTVSLLFAACKKNDNDVQVPVAALMSFNLVADQPGVDVALSGNLLPGGTLPFTSYSGRYFNIIPGNRTIQSYVSLNNKSLDSNSYTFEADKYYSLFVVGANNHYKNVVSPDNYDSLTASSGKAYVRYVNAIPDSSMPKVTITANGSAVINTNAGFAQVSQFVPVTPGQVTVDLTNDGDISATRTISLQEKKAYTVLLMGMPGATDSTKAVQIRFIENGSVTD